MDVLFGNLIHHWIDRIPASVKIGQDLCNFPRPTINYKFYNTSFIDRAEFERMLEELKNRGERKLLGERRKRDREGKDIEE